jgi:hypothetical protein
MMNANIHRLAIVLLVVAAPACGDTAPAAPNSTAPIVVNLKRTACYGHCPIYEVTVHADGTVEYDGFKDVVVKGRKIGHLSPAEMKSLDDAFATAKYLDLDGKYDERDCYDMTDHSSAVTSYHLGDRTKTVDHYQGCRRAPKELTTLEQRIDEIVGSARWTGVCQEPRHSKAHGCGFR